MWSRDVALFNYVGTDYHTDKTTKPYGGSARGARDQSPAARETHVPRLDPRTRAQQRARVIDGYDPDTSRKCEIRACPPRTRGIFRLTDGGKSTRRLDRTSRYEGGGSLRSHCPSVRPGRVAGSGSPPAPRTVVRYGPACRRESARLGLPRRRPADRVEGLRTAA